MSQPPVTSGKLLRSLTLIPAAAVILANIIGTGVFVKARVMTCNVGSPGMVLTVWLVAGLLTLCGALVYAELGAMMPRSGGEFHFIGRAFGRRLGFLYGWTKTIALGASAAALAIVFVVFLNDLSGGVLPPLALLILPVFVIAVATGFNLLSARSNGFTATVLTAVKVALVLFVGLGAFFLADGNWGNFSLGSTGGSCEGVPDSAKLGMRGFGAAMLAVNPLDRALSKLNPVATAITKTGRISKARGGSTPPERSFKKTTNTMAKAAAEAPRAMVFVQP